MNKDKNSVSVIILTKNEEAQIEECLKTCDIFDEIIIIDSFSKDKTCDLARKYTTRIYQKEFVDFKSQREFGLSLAACGWVFFLDADERLSDGLKNTIKEFVSQEEYSFLNIPRRNYLLGNWVRYSGWFPDYTGRLVEKSTAYFEQDIIHEKIASNGKVLTLENNSPAYLIHYTCNDFSKYFRKINHYTTLEAAQEYRTKKFKTSRRAILSRSFGMFTQTLFAHKGYKDGMAGFIIACFNFIYSLLLMIKIWELRKIRSKDE
ncbi:glycosyltransferase family 2 protein [Candidatus Margulisiibacteriota bacterium]